MTTTGSDRHRDRSSSVQGSTANMPPRARPSRALWFVVGLCLVVSLLSLALSATMFHGLTNARQAAVEGLDEAIAALDSFSEQGYQYEFALDQEIPISVDIPIEQEMTFPVEGTFPIDTTVEVPINAGILGTFTVEVPINTSIDVETSVPIRVEENFRIETTVPVSMTIPIEIQPEDPEVNELLQGIRQWLEEIRESL